MINYFIYLFNCSLIHKSLLFPIYNTFCYFNLYVIDLVIIKCIIKVKSKTVIKIK